MDSSSSVKGSQSPMTNGNLIRGLSVLLLLVNSLTFLLGFILLVLGGVYYSQHDAYNEQWAAGDAFCSAATFCIIIGFFTCFVSFLGFYGALKQNYCLLLVFCILLGLVVLTEFVLGITLFALAKDRSLDGMVANAMIRSMNKFDNDHGGHGTPKVWNIMQTEFECCGAFAASDWHNSTQFQAPWLPESCCSSVPVDQKCQLDSTSVFKEGCVPKLMKTIRAHGADIGAVVIVFATVQIGLMIVATQIMKRIGTPRKSCPPFY